MLADFYLDTACSKLMVVDRVLGEYGNETLATYLSTFITKPKCSYQKLGDILHVVQQYTRILLGEDIAHRIIQDLERCPVALTANHHGVDYFAQSIQGSIIFALNAFSGKYQLTTIPIFSCGNIPLDNLTYPRGMLLYGVSHDELDAMPIRLPVFSNKHRRRLVSTTGPFDLGMINRSKNSVDQLCKTEKINPRLGETLHHILEDQYSDPKVIDLPSYSQQAVILNNTIWRQIFPDLENLPQIVFLELEKIASSLLEMDLANSDSLAWRVMFDRQLRHDVIDELDGERTCWTFNELESRLQIDTDGNNHNKKANGSGTIFFWGINDRGRRVPLYIHSNGSKEDKFCGVDDLGETYEFPYSPDSIIEGLQNGQLLPSLFTSFLVISLARGITCAGGYFQGAYLPAMQKGLVNALKKNRDYADIGDLVAQVPTDKYLSGMLAVMSRSKAGYLNPSGPMEIIAGGGLSAKDLERIQSITVKDAHIAALFETAPDVAPEDFSMPNRKKELSADCSLLLEDKIIVK